MTLDDLAISSNYLGISRYLADLRASNKWRWTSIISDGIIAH